MIATGQYPELHVAVATGGRGDSTSPPRFVGPHTERVPTLRLRDHGCIHVGIVGTRHRVPGSVEIAVDVSTFVHDDPGKRLDGGRRVKRHNLDLCAGGHQIRESTLRNRPTADDNHLAAVQIEPGEIVDVVATVVSIVDATVFIVDATMACGRID